MREIPFRGKRLDTGEWVKGYYVKTESGNALIINNVAEYGCGYCIETIESIGNYEVDTDTVGQYTGLEDKNGVKIFEGDIVRYKNRFECEYGCVKFGLYDNKQDQGFYIQWPEETYWRSDLGFWAVRHDRKKYLEVIGNIHDNPELLHKELTP